jgi:hypothetical protein
MSALNLSFKSISIPALVTLPIAISGSVFVCAYASAPFTMNFDGGSDFEMSQGWQITTPEPFSTIIITNSTNTVLDVTFYCGTAGLAYFAPPSAPLQTGTIGVPSSLPVDTSNSQSFTGLIANYPNPQSPLSGHRKQILIANLSPANQPTWIITVSALSAIDGTAEFIGVVFPSRSWTVETDATIILESAIPNPGPTAIVGQVYYL